MFNNIFPKFKINYPMKIRSNFHSENYFFRKNELILINNFKIFKYKSRIFFNIQILNKQEIIKTSILLCNGDLASIMYFLPENFIEMFLFLLFEKV